jgi:hypothetical protein
VPIQQDLVGRLVAFIDEFISVKHYGIDFKIDLLAETISEWAIEPYN